MRCTSTSGLAFLAILTIAISGLARAAEPLPDVLAGDGLSVRFTDKSATPAGTLERDGQSYPFTSRFENNRIVGTFQAGGTGFPFTITQVAGGFTLTTGDSRYALVGAQRDGGAAAPPLRRGDVPPAPQRVGDLTYAPHTVVDPASTLEVIQLLVPKGWQVEPGVLWRPLNAQFVTLKTAVVDPQRGWAVQWIPLDQFSFDPAMFENARRQNAKPFTLGGVELIDRLHNAPQYIEHIVLPRYRNQRGLKVIKTEELPGVVQAIDKANANLRAMYRQMGREMAYSAARMRVEYPGPGGVTMEEDIYCVINCSWDPRGIAMAKSVGLTGEYYFVPERLYSYSAPKGELDAAAPYLQTIYLSARATARWFAFVQNLQGAIGKIAIDRHAMEVAARKAITDSQRKSVEESWKSADQQSREVGALLSGTQARSNPNNPNGPPVAGPAGKNSWTNPQGEWKHLEPGDDPNTHPNSTKNWTMAGNTKN